MSWTAAPLLPPNLDPPAGPTRTATDFCTAATLTARHQRDGQRVRRTVKLTNAPASPPFWAMLNSRNSQADALRPVRRGRSASPIKRSGGSGWIGHDPRPATAGGSAHATHQIRTDAFTVVLQASCGSFGAAHWASRPAATRPYAASGKRGDSSRFGTHSSVPARPRQPARLARAQADALSHATASGLRAHVRAGKAPATGASTNRPRGPTNGQCVCG